MPTFYDILVYIASVLVCYNIRVFISYLWYNKKDDNLANQTNYSTEMALFFPEDHFIQSYERRPESSSLKEMLSVIKKTKKSLDICMYSISLFRIINECIELHKNNVIIRIITNYSSNRSNESFGYRLTNYNNEVLIEKKQLKKLQKAGIEIRFLILRNGYMHNKFAIIDDNILVNGSLNWSKNAVYNNYEDVIITSDRQLVSVYLNKFNEFWSSSIHFKLVSI